MATRVGYWVVALLVSSAPALRAQPGSGFCPNGVYAGTIWRVGQQPFNLKLWGSYCSLGDDSMGSMESAQFTAPEALSLYLAGYPGRAGLRLALKNAESGAQIELKPPNPPGTLWQLSSFPVPPEWKGKPVSLIAEDRVKGIGGWFGFSEPVNAPKEVVDTGFCGDGVYPDTRWPSGPRPPNLRTWGSFCRGGDRSTGRVESQRFLAPETLQLYLAGYPGGPGLRLALKNLDSGAELELKPPSQPGTTWTLSTFHLTSEWSGKPAVLTAEDRATGLAGWLAFSEPLLPTFSLTHLSGDGAAGGFCEGGAAGARWPPSGRPAGVTTHGSFCALGEADTGTTASEPFVVGGYVSLYLAGYPGANGLDLALEDIANGEQLPLLPASTPGAAWVRNSFRVPDAWVTRKARIVAADNAPGANGWLAFSDPVDEDATLEIAGVLEMLALVIALFVLLFLPSAAVCCLMASRGVTDLLDLITAALLTLGLTGYLAFWSYFFNHSLGIAVCLAGLVASVVVVGKSRARLTALRPMALPALLVLLASVFVLSFGFLRGGQDNSLQLAPRRFAPPDLAGDNILPKLLADGVFAGHIPRPLMNDWLSSDRPPLQAGNVLWTYLWTPEDGRDVPYLVSSVFLQCSFLLGVWAFLSAAKAKRGAIAVAVATCLFSGFTYLNGFYTWPKLYPVAFLLIAAAYLLTDRFKVRQNAWTGAAVGLAVAFAMLCHGGSMFALAGLAAAMLCLRRLPSRRMLLPMVGVAIVAYVPWMLYQKFVDPPGDRLIKFHLAGVQEVVPNVGVAELTLRSYQQAGIGQVLWNKIANVEMLFGRESFDALASAAQSAIAADPASRDHVGEVLRHFGFHYWGACVGLAVFGPIALIIVARSRRKPTPEFQVAVRLWLTIALTTAIWCLVMFGPGATAVHQGSYFTVVAAFVGSALAFWTLYPPIAVAAAALGAIASIVLFADGGTAAAPGRIAGAFTGPIHWSYAVVCILSAAGVLVSLKRFASEPAEAKVVWPVVPQAVARVAAIPLIAAFALLGAARIATTAYRPVAYALEPAATTEAFLMPIGAVHPASLVEQALRSLPADKPLLFVRSASDDPGGQVFFTTRYLAYPRPVSYVTCSGPGAVSETMSIASPSVPLGGVVFFQVEPPRWVNDQNRVTPSLIVSSHSGSEPWTSYCP